MRRICTIVGMAVGITALAACATNQREEGEVATGEAGAEVADTVAEAGEARTAPRDTLTEWLATIEATEPGIGLNGEATARSAETQTLASIDIEFAEPGAVHPWHIHQGDCGDTPVPAVVGQMTAYPPIEVDQDGEGEATATINATLDPDGDYQVKLHQSPTETGTIVACGELDTFQAARQAE